MTLQDYLRVLRAGWWLILAFVLIGLGAGFLFTKVSSPSYSATAVVYVTVPGAATPADLQQGNVFAVQRAASYASLATTPAVLREAAANTPGTTVDDLQGSVTALARTDTSLIDVSATAVTSSAAAAHANAVAQALIAEAPGLDSPAIANPIDLRIVQEATPASAPDSPDLRTDLLVGLIAGLIIGFVVVLVRYALDGRVRTPRDVATPRPTSLTALPAAPRGLPWRRRPPNDGSPSFGMLRSHLVISSEPGGFAVAPVSSGDAMPVAQGLARALKGIEASVVVVDARSGTAAATDGASPEEGLAEVLVGRAVWRSAIAMADDAPAVLGAGTTSDEAMALRESPTMAALLEDLGTEFDWVLVCCPPLLSDSAAATIAAQVGAAVVVVEAGTTRRTDYQLARERLAGVGVVATHVVLGAVRRADLRPVGDAPGSDLYPGL